jgi:hypothetical protein
MNSQVIPMLASTAGDGSSLVHQTFVVLVIAVCALIVWWLGNMAGKAFSAPAIAFTVWNGLFILLGAIVVINFLMSLIGHGFIQY